MAFSFPRFRLLSGSSLRHRRKGPSESSLAGGSWRATALERRVMLAGDTSVAVAESVGVELSYDESAALARRIAPSSHSETLVIIDGSVPHHEILTSDALKQADVVLLDSSRDGLTQVSEILAHRQGLRSLHLVSHGQPGQIQLGNQMITLDVLHHRAQEIRGWSGALADRADVLVYGCQTGQGQAGQRLVQALAVLTGADVAASDDRTGTESEGGDWQLEVTAGSVESALAFSTEVQRRWNHSLPISIRAAGATGEEQLELQIDGVTVQTWNNVGGDYFNGTFQTLTYSGAGVSADRIRVAFTNDGTTATGLDRNVRIDSLTIDGSLFEAEAPTVFSTGTYLEPQGCVPGYWQSEFLHCNGYLQFSTNSSSSSTISIRAAGSTGSEQMQLLIDDVAVQTWDNVQGDFDSGSFQTFTYSAGSQITADRIRIAFINDGTTATGADRNLRVDGITLDGVIYEAEAPSVFSTSTWVNGVGNQPGFFQTEFMNCGGYLQFDAITNSGSTITVRAAGATGEERMVLQIDGISVREWNNVGGNYETGEFLSFNYVAPSTITPDRVRILFANDGNTASGADKNLRIDQISIDSTVYQAEASTVYSTGTWISGIGVVPGFYQSEYLQSGGYLDFGSKSGGVISLLNSVIEISESGGTATVTIVRQGGSDGTSTVDYRTVASSASAGSDYVERIGTLTFLEGETQKSLLIEIINDSLAEPNETFGFAIDNVNGGARLGAPRTATITILDNDTLLPNFANFNSSANLDLNGNALTTGGRLRLTPATNNTLGSAFFTTPLSVDSSTSFQTQFQFSINGGNGTGGADGFAFVLQNSAAGSGAISAAGGGSLGYQGIGNSLAVKFDTYQNPGEVNNNHIAVLANGLLAPALQTRTTSIDLNSGQTLTAWIDYNANIDQLAVFLAANTTKPTTPLLTVSVDLAAYVGSRAFLGFTAAAGGLNNQHEIVNWQFNTNVPPLTGPPTPGNNLFDEAVFSGFTQPTAIAWTPDGSNMYVAEQRGIVRVARNGVLNTTPFIDISSQVNGTRDRGLLGMAVHPDFANNPYVYLLFTYDPPEVYQNASHPLAGPDRNGNRAGRLIRVTANAATNYTTAIPGSEVVLLGTNSTWNNFNAFVNSTTDFTAPPAGILPDGTNIRDFIASDSESHTVAALDFAPDGALFVSIGDGTSYNRADPRTVRVQDINNLSGKILRIDPITGDGLPDNPFYNGDPDANRSKVYQYGLRNPFRIATDPVSGRLYVGDVGWTTWEEINVGGPGTNYGWPYYEGATGTNVRTPGYRDLPAAQAFYASGQVATPALLALNHATDGINAIVMGDVYTGSAYPAEFRGDLFFNDLGQGIVRNASLNAAGQITSVQTFTTGAVYVVQIAQGPDGNLYYVDLDNGKVGRWVFV